MRELEETKAHDVAYHLIEDWAKDVDRPLTEQNIKNLNEIILVRPFWKEAQTPDGQPTRRLIKVGDYKEHPNSVRLQNGEIFDYASPLETPIKMRELIEWYRQEENNIHPLTLAAMLHYQFVRIHPFDDGNGRVSRLLMNYVLLRNGFPPVVIKSADKANYLKALHLADVGNFEPFIQYIGEQLIWSLELSIKAAKGESIDEPDDLDKKLALLEKELEAESSDNQLQTQLTYNALNNHFRRWIFALMDEIAKTSHKFAKYYLTPQSRIDLNISNNHTSFDVQGDCYPHEFAKKWEERFIVSNDSDIYDAQINYYIGFNGYIRGGINSFGCHYPVMLKFEQYKYSIVVGVLNEETGGKIDKVILQYLHHQHLAIGEIKSIGAMVGDNLLNHINYHRNKTNGASNALKQPE